MLKHQLTPEELRTRQATFAPRDDQQWLRNQFPDVFARSQEQTSTVTLKPSTDTASRNPLRPRTLDEMIGQESLKPLLRRLIDKARAERRPLDPLLLVGGAGTGKTTMAGVIAHELGTRVFELKAPLTTDVLMALRESAHDGDVVFVDEIHMQVSGDRRGITQAADPEAFYMLLEDHVLATSTGPLDFPLVTWIGATTDVGLLPEPLTMRFTFQPRLQPYTVEEMARIARANASAFKLALAPGVAELFAKASRATPRVMNSYVRGARSLCQGGVVDGVLARVVVTELFSTTLDGLTESMQIVLRFLYSNCRRPTRDGVIYTASVNTLATAAGHGRDTKAIALLVEPYLFQRGLLEVRPSGRTLTPAGVERARQL